MQLLFGSVARAVDHRTAPAGPFTVQWEFADAEPWHVRVDNGATARRGCSGRADRVDVEVRCRYEDWVDIVAGRLDPRRALVSGKLRPHGSPRSLWAAPRAVLTELAQFGARLVGDAAVLVGERTLEQRPDVGDAVEVEQLLGRDAADEMVARSQPALDSAASPLGSPSPGQ